MNLEKLFTWIIGIVIAFAACGQLETLQRWIWRAQARVVYESRTSTWGSPRFFSREPMGTRERHQKQKNSNQTTVGEPGAHDTPQRRSL